MLFVRHLCCYILHLYWCSRTRDSLPTLYVHNEGAQILNILTNFQKLKNTSQLSLFHCLIVKGKELPAANQEAASRIRLRPHDVIEYLLECPLPENKEIVIQMIKHDKWPQRISITKTQQKVCSMSQSRLLNWSIVCYIFNNMAN